MLDNGERQVAPSIDDIRADHVERYMWAAGIIAGRVLDSACGVGYGARLLATTGADVVAIDRSAEALEYGRKHYSGPQYVQHDLARNLPDLGKFDAAVSFETIEHLADPRPFLRSIKAKRLLVSVPNEAEFPHHGQIKFHYRHYTAEELEALLQECGWRVAGWYGQDGTESAVTEGAAGRTIIADARRVPRSVSILGFGPSLHSYIDKIRDFGRRQEFCTETWAINGVGNMVQCDRVFHMDDVRVQEARAAAGNVAIGQMLEWLKGVDVPVYTSQPHPSYPCQAYPLEDVVNSIGWAWFNSTAAYAVALAIHEGFDQINLFGLDFTYPDRQSVEAGRGCVEFLLGLATARGITIGFPPDTSLTDCVIGRPLYGYDCLDVNVTHEGDYRRLEFVPKPTPSAETIEARYDKTRKD